MICRAEMVFAIVLMLIRKVLRAALRSRIAVIAILFVCIALINTSLFYYAEVILGHRQDLDFFKCFYWAIVTMATVGYGDIVPTTFLGHIIATETIIIGIAVYTLMISSLAEVFMRKTLRSIMGLGKLKGVDILVIGSNEICREAIEELRASGTKLRIGWLMDKRLREVPEDVDYVVGDPTDDKVLERAGVRSAKYILICLSSDSRAIHTVLTVKRLNRSATIAAVAWSRKAQELLKEAGASIVIPLKIVGRALASAVFEPMVPSFIEEVTTARGVADLVQIDVGKNIEGKSLAEYVKELESKDGKRYIPLMISDGSGKAIVAPSSDRKLKAGDKVLLLKAERDESETTR